MSMSQHVALIVAGCVFAIIAFMHLLRLVRRTEVTVGTRKLSMGLSVLGFIVSLGLCVWMFTALY